ncbi:MAG: AbrB/MazE/SpoVT family DNA-binding domain-containing protein [Proteobacteria bacterium]|nr:AbrB/MazE/SpoVT family DNA-binding domain-containing protein [Desulfobulbaceae bacterium]MBU4152766.1 AbrB/MazE/SpoVT family DNA-binding domain-containing protein [Pseudomonadota bacterium]
MPTTSLSSKGQVIIPKPIRALHNWHPGQKLEIIDTGDGILLKAATPFTATTLDQVTGCLPHHGPAKTIEEMEEAIRHGAKETNRDRG